MWWGLRKRVHPSWLIAMLSLGVGGGIAGSLVISSKPLIPLFLLLPGLTLLVIGFWQQRRWTLPVIFIAGACVGLSKGSAYKADIESVRDLYGTSISIQGSVTDDPRVDVSGTVSIILANVRTLNGGCDIPGRVSVSLLTHQLLKRGYRVVVVGTFVASKGLESGAMFRAKLVGAYDPFPGDIARRVRDWFVEAVKKAIPEPQSSLGVGYLVGQKSALPPDLLEALQVAGLTHVVVASGYNLTILVRLSRRLLSKLSKFAAFAGSVLLVVCMMAVTGLSPSMTRAGLVTGLSLATWYYGRAFHPLVLLPLAAALTLLWEPSYGWGDVGWLLSFTAFAGVMILAPLLQRFFFGESEPGVMRQVLGETIAAHVITLPVLVVVFSQISNVAVPANMLIVPLVPLAMLLTFFAGIGTLLVPVWAVAWGLPATGLLTYMTSMAQWWSELPWAVTDIKIDWPVAATAYLVIFLLCLLLARHLRYSFRNSSIIE